MHKIQYKITGSDDNRQEILKFSDSLKITPLTGVGVENESYLSGPPTSVGEKPYNSVQ